MAYFLLGQLIGGAAVLLGFFLWMNWRSIWRWMRKLWSANARA